jgi:hypothetical protein
MTEHPPIEEKYREQMNAIARALDHAINSDIPTEAKRIGFVLLVFPFNDHTGRVNYISNGANRRDIIKMFQELILRFEHGDADADGNPPGVPEEGCWA